MADIRINSLPSTATTPASDDYFALDGAANGTRKILATNVANNVSDVILGASGPSVKSTLSARAPRQGLVLDGTNVVTSTIGSAIGTSAFSWSGWIQIPSAPASYSVLSGIGTSNSILQVGASLQLVWQSNGKLRVQISNAANNGGVYADVDGFSSLVGKIASVSITRSGSTLAAYINGISQTTTPVTYGTSPGDFSNTISGTNLIVGGTGGGSGTILSGYVSGPLIYNRALSASEVVALYEAGAPASADYGPSGSPAGTAITRTLTVGTWTGSVGGSTFTISTSSTGYISGGIVSYGSLPKCKFRVNYDLTINSGPGPTLSDGNVFSSARLTAGTGKTVELTNPNAGNQLLVTNDYAAGNYVLTINSVTVIGLLLAPDAAQAGGGLVWYDTSGNSANITLPASGVSWNVPTSGYVTSGSSLNLSAGGTNQNITLTPSGTGVLSVVSGQSVFSGATTSVSIGTATLDPLATSRRGLAVYNEQSSQGGTVSILSNNTGSGGTQGAIFFGTTGASSGKQGAAIQVANDGAITTQATGRLELYINNGTAMAEALRVTSARNLLVGGTTDISGSGGLKVFGSTASTSTTSGALQVVGGVGVGGAINAGSYVKAGGDVYVANGSALILDTGITNYMTGASGTGVKIYSSSALAATFAGANTTLAGNLTVSGGTITSGSGTLTLNSSANTVVLQSAGTTALTLDTSQNATFAGTTVRISSSGDAKIIPNNSGATTGFELWGYGGDNATSIYVREGGLGIRYYAYGGTGTSDGHLFYTGGLKGSQTLKLRVNDNGVQVTPTTASTSTSTGALTVAGGVGVAGAVNVGGAIAIGNTVNTVSPTSPNRTITMVIGGTTYYIHAKTTND